MNINPTVSSSILRIVKCEPDLDHIVQFNNNFSCDINGQKEEHEQEINRLQKTHDEQIYKFCHELEKSSLLIHQFKVELDSMRVSLTQKEMQLKNQSSNQDLQTKNLELVTENTKLKNELSLLTTRYQTLFNEMQEARQYVLNMITSLD
jgi:hypothetical protein